jgi:small neutral amino acid transporter SnatA (MarC family)
MIPRHQDLLVGIVGIALGLFLLACAITNWRWYYSLYTANWLERRFGRGGARSIHALLGLGLVALGVAIALGYRWPLVGPG